MKIIRSYNNNVVLSRNKAGKEVILIGRGIAYGLHKGDDIDMMKVQKVFEVSLIGREKNRYEKIIQEMPVEYVSVADEVISYIKGHCTKHINDSIYITMTDHIATTIDRLKEGIEFDNAMLSNVKLLYQEEYQLALQAVEILRKRFPVRIDDSEANFITLHIVTAEMDANMEQTYMITAITEEILKVVRKHFDIQEKDNYDFERFLTHCRFFVHRVINNQLEDKGLANFLLPELQRANGDEPRICVNEIAEMIEKKYRYKVNDDEKMYLLIYLYRLTK